MTLETRINYSQVSNAGTTPYTAASTAVNLFSISAWMPAVREAMGFVFHVSAGCWSSGSVVLSSPRASSSEPVLDSSLCNSLNQNSRAQYTENFRKVQYCTQAFQLLFIIFFPLISSYYNWVGNGFVAPQWKPFPESFTFSWLLQRKMGSPKNGAVRTPPGDPNLCQCPGRDLSQDPPELVGPWMAEESSGKGTFGAGLNLWDFY